MQAKNTATQLSETLYHTVHPLYVSNSHSNLCCLPDRAENEQLSQNHH